MPSMQLHFHIDAIAVSNEGLANCDDWANCCHKNGSLRIIPYWPSQSSFREGEKLLKNSCKKKYLFITSCGLPVFYISITSSSQEKFLLCAAEAATIAIKWRPREVPLNRTTHHWQRLSDRQVFFMDFYIWKKKPKPVASLRASNFRHSLLKHLVAGILLHVVLPEAFIRNRLSDKVNHHRISLL